MKKERKKDAEFQWKREGVLGALSSGFSRSLLDDPKALKEEEAGGFIRGTSEWSTQWNSNSTDASSGCSSKG